MTEVRLGDKRIPFIYQGDELIHPNPVKDGLVLWYDFSAMSNDDAQRDVAEDLSGNGNHGTLQNFNFTPESGYDKNKLLFDGVDDYASVTTFDSVQTPANTTVCEFVVDLEDTQGAFFAIPTENERLAIKQRGGEITVGRYTTKWYGESALVETFGKHHIVVEITLKGTTEGVDETFDLRVYIDGMEIETSNPTYYSEGRYYSFPVTNLLIGYQGSVASASEYAYFKSVIYSAKIYNRPLTPEEIAHNYAIEKERFGIE